MKRDLEGFRNKVEQANHEIQQLKENAQQKDAKISEMRKRQTGMGDKITEMHEMKAARKQMEIQKQQTYSELGTEFQGM